MNLWNETKSVPVSRHMVMEAYKKVHANHGSAGIDKVSMEQFDANRSKCLYKVWNRLASGSYFPPAVKETEILKKDGKIRKLGIPTISDRIAQMVIKNYLEPRFEKIFSNASYGYRQQKNAHQALESARLNCRKYDWVIDLDIKGFFDNIDHRNLMLALKKHVSEKWCMMYIERWLKAPIQEKTGKLVFRMDKGTPQGGVISPLLANVFLHYVLDKWLELSHSGVEMERYADDAILHCHTRNQAERLLEELGRRMSACGLELHPEKTKIVYCKDYRRRGNYEKVKFDFLGYSFQPRTTKSKKTGKLFLGFDCAISIVSKKRIADKLEELDIVNLNVKSIVGVATFLDPYIRGWLNYFGKFRIWALNPVFQLLRKRLVRWVRKRYKRYKNNLIKAYKWLDKIKVQFPYLFYHWRLGFN